MSENPAAVEKRTCRFPGCQRPPEAPEASTGRPPEYCDDPTHNRASAWRARQQVSDTATRVAEARPVDSARQRASEITGQVTGMIEHLGQQLSVLLEELRTVGDPEAAEAQIESVSTEAAEQVAAANARATRAEQTQRRAEAQKDEADAAAEEATRASEQSAQELSGVREELHAAQAREERLAAELAEVRAAAAVELGEAQAENSGLQAELESVRVQLERTERDRDTALTRVEAEENARNEAEQRATGAVQRAELEAARADREETAAAEVRAQLESLRAEYDAVREAAGEMRSRVAALTAERDAAKTDVDREREHGEQRVKDLRETYGRQIDQLRDELAQARETPARERPGAKPQEEGKD